MIDPMFGCGAKRLEKAAVRAMYTAQGEPLMTATTATSPREHRDAIARQATALLGLDGSDAWLHLTLGRMAAQGVFTNGIDIGKAIGSDRSAALRGLMMGADRPEFRRAGIVMSTAEGLIATADLWLDPDASDGAYALACEPIALALIVDKVEGRVMLLFETSAWSTYQGAFAAAMAAGQAMGAAGAGVKARAEAAPTL
jgi:hypothetical protein